MSADAGSLRGWLKGVFLAGAVGTTAELLLLEHTGDASQLIPVVLLVAAVVGLGLVSVWPTPAVVLVFHLTMAACIVSGVAGVGLHYTGNAEFEREIQPDAAGLALFREAVAGATPVLAPGTMALLGAVGLLAVERRQR